MLTTDAKKLLRQLLFEIENNPFGLRADSIINELASGMMDSTSEKFEEQLETIVQDTFGKCKEDASTCPSRQFPVLLVQALYVGQLLMLSRIIRANRNREHK